jgi:hypothetical protein
MTKEGSVYMPEHYAEMKTAAAEDFATQWRFLGQVQPVQYKIRPYIFAWGRHRQSQDMVDNLPGTLYDALVLAKVLKDDSAKWCPGSIHDLIHSHASPRVDILLAPWLPFSQSLAQITEVIDWLRIHPF